MKISVALAAYNGEKFIEEQLRSILSQLGEGDEVVVSDDNPSGATKAAVLSMGDPRIKYVEGPGQGVIKNFEFAISQTSGDIIFLSDQDDVWLPGKVAAVRREIENGALLVMHDAKITDENLSVTEESFIKAHNSKLGFVRNIIRNSYIGCCMAFSSELKSKILPFPKNLPMHDQWIGLKAERAGKVVLLDEPYLLYRRSGDSLTGGKTTLLQKLKWRIAIIEAVL